MSEKHGPPAPPAEAEMSLDEALVYALELQREGRVEAAAQLYTRILEQVPDHADALNFLGVARFQLGDTEAAENLIRRAIELTPDSAGAHNNLGNVLARLHRTAEAAQEYQRVIELEPNNADAHSNLGALLRVSGKVAEAETVLRRALELAPQHAEVLHNLGNVLAQTDRFEEAVDMFSQAAELRPYDGKNYLVLGAALYSLKREQAAVKVYQRWLEMEPDSAEAQHMIAAATRRDVPERASDAYVQSTFDRFSASFDSVLNKLDYRAPQLLIDAVARLAAPPQAELDVLDAGCGTGLSGPLLKPWARRLVGVDLSPKMIEKAKLREVYDDLAVSELTAYLSDRPACYDLVIAADTVCYFGDLTAVVTAAATSLRPSGWFGFTAEKLQERGEPTGYCIQLHGRYTHTEGYIRRVLSDAGFVLVSIEEAVLRMERKEPVEGLVVTAVKPPE
jgi:predicted TPR repeat methyltransferase